MDQIFAAVQDIFTRYGWHILAGIAALLATYFKAFKVAWDLLCKLWNFRKERKIQKDLHPFYTELELQQARQYYVESQCQNIAPSKEDEPGQSAAFAVRRPILPFFLQYAFQPKDDTQFYIVLADSGMGKNHLYD